MATVAADADPDTNTPPKSTDKAPKAPAARRIHALRLHTPNTTAAKHSANAATVKTDTVEPVAARCVVEVRSTLSEDTASSSASKSAGLPAPSNAKAMTLSPGATAPACHDTTFVFPLAVRVLGIVVVASMEVMVRVPALVTCNA
ncbi:hypothetical protein BBOH_1223 [Bifidobacterium bohemicum DSM 22767]|uniref:Uncharacterized protein n=1 Tax=Bifidobacterium bohemicum DSM 22767 TaxID=1437606 RepID=A0A086ZEL3_9BIFI|nr:hypothetical protein BBOH_1223 [Bifidobacterium bohemicum DSM 22767]